ncbi:HlyD family secretion protein [Hymenobacter sp. RP-2-7]|uniref:HlyD family secretion protein n=1 Tax=Hymenobacter polaris TaxID=2682546 RepID=A0A7Y0AFU7_9BACT|nr:HlyD family secretion protein [Hymenobacter polaris]NML66589.1 HlyD family secretion protein [Hymenobacter polaris]
MPTTSSPAATHDPARRRVADPSDAPDQRPGAGRRTVPQAKDDPADTTHKPFYRQGWFFIVAGLVLLLVAWWGISKLIYSNHHETTDDAFVEGHAVRVSPRAAGQVLKVYVRDNQQVKAGQLLLELDPRDYRARLAQAQAAVVSAEAQRNTSRKAAEARRSVIAQQQAQLAAAEATLAQTQAEATATDAQAANAVRDEQRYAELYKTDAVSRQRYDQAATTARSATAQADAAHRRTQTALAQARQAAAVVTQAQNDYRQATEQISVTEAQIGEAQAAADQAALQLSYTKVYASEPGRITSKAVDEGQTVAVGQQLLLIAYGQLWVTANFKETQLTNMRVGQPALLAVDAYPGKQFRGRVESFQRGTGARFSLLPAENATGNYVKVVQRIPVKIVFDGQPDLSLLAPGMSVVPEVDITVAPTQQDIERAHREALPQVTDRPARRTVGPVK